MNPRIVTLVLVLLLSTTLTACGQTIVHDANAQVRELPPFHGIEVSGGMTLYLTQGPEQGVAVSAGDEKNVSKIKAEVKNGILKITPESGVWNGWNWSNRSLKAYVTVNKVESIECNGASAVRVSGELQVKALTMELSGASSFKGTIKGDELKIEVTGASSATLDGNVQSFSAEASGASSIKGYELITATCAAQASGASAISITATKEINLEASGASAIRYKGDAAIKRAEASGASSVKKKE